MVRSLFAFQHVVEDLMQDSPFRPVDTEKLIKLLYDYLEENILLITDSDSEMRDFVYQQHAGSDNKYAIVATSYVDNGYVMFVVEDGVQLLSNPKKSFTNYLKENLVKNFEGDKKLLGPQIGELVAEVESYFNYLRTLMKNSVRSKRGGKFALSKKETVEYPSLTELKKFYECGRKTIVTESETQASKGMNFYSCHHCGLKHQGKVPTGQSIPSDIMIGRWRTAWRRYHNV